MSGGRWESRTGCSRPGRKEPITVIELRVDSGVEVLGRGQMELPRWGVCPHSKHTLHGEPGEGGARGEGHRALGLVE